MFFGNRDGCSDILWLILILCCCCGNDRGGVGGFGNGCEDILFLLLILCCCGNGIGGRRDVCC